MAVASGIHRLRRLNLRMASSSVAPKALNCLASPPISAACWPAAGRSGNPKTLTRMSQPMFRALALPAVGEAGGKSFFFFSFFFFLSFLSVVEAWLKPG